MKHRTLGCTSLNVSELCLATHRFVRPTDEAAYFSILDAFHAHGGDFIQVSAGAHAATAAAAMNVPATVVARWRRTRGIPRDDLVLALTAVFSPLPDGNPRGLTHTVNLVAEHALRFLQSDRLDILIIRWAGAGNPPESLRRGLDWLVREGLVRYVAFADLPGWRAVAALRDGFDRMHCRINALETDYSLVSRAPFETELEGLCREQRLGFLARSAAGTWGLPRPQNEPPPARSDWMECSFALRAQRNVAHAIAEIARCRGCSFAQIAIAWVLHHPVVTSGVITAQSAAQLHDLAGATHVVLDRHELQQLHRASSVQRISIGVRSDDPVFARDTVAVESPMEVETI